MYYCTLCGWFRDVLTTRIFFSPSYFHFYTQHYKVAAMPMENTTIVLAVSDQCVYVCVRACVRACVCVCKHKKDTKKQACMWTVQ